MTDSDQLNDIVNRLVSSTDPDEVRRLYKLWSETYDDDLDAFGYVAPQIGVDIFAGIISDKSARIHDAGCGTGLVGVLLTREGYTCVHGSDFSPEMLDRARMTNCYKSLVAADFSEVLDIESNTFDAIISIGVYTKRFHIHFLREMVRTLKSGGSMVFTCRELYFNEVSESIRQLHIEKKIVRSSVALDNYMTGQQARAYYVVLQKTQD
ncbi:hypothetical protein AB833_26555 [Chromatiales bacterium (ex Bugula neritina AB1)]|nr:hypothetical protein AB833_26555 [Chromatiales bacterium (ex Bugula neritina AB1)]